jgi:hypothetical protein
MSPKVWPHAWRKRYLYFAGAMDRTLHQGIEHRATCNRLKNVNRFAKGAAQPTAFDPKEPKAQHTATKTERTQVPAMVSLRLQHPELKSVVKFKGRYNGKVPEEP